MDIIRSIGRASVPVGFVAGLGGLAAQSLIFEDGNFSETGGAVFIPMLGEHGIYTSEVLGGAWYLCGAMFLLSLVSAAATASAERRKRR